MRFRVLLVLLLAFCVVPAFAQPTILEGLEGNLQLVKEEQVMLQENLEFLSDLHALAAVPGGGLIVTTRGGMPIADGTGAFVVLYDEDGEQVRTLGGPGQGPFEFQGPGPVRVEDDRAIVWDGMQLKFITYQLDGPPIEEWRGFTRNLQDFQLAGDRIVIYQSGGWQEDFIVVYDPETESTLCETGRLSDEGRILQMYMGSGGLALHRGEILYATPDERRIYRVNPDTCEETVLPFEVPDFSIDEIDFGPSDFDRTRDFLFSNSRICGIYPVGDYVVVQAENGTYDEDRETLLLVFDDTLEHVDTIRISPEWHVPMGRHARLSDGHRLGFLTEERELRMLNWWRVQPVE